MLILIWALIGYACGSLPSAWIIAKLTRNLDVLREVHRGAGEADAHVVLHQRAGRISYSAAAMDVLKGFTPMILAVQGADPYAIAACAIGAVAGHCWPPVLYRYAGRGLATAAGTFLAFLPIEMVAAGLVRLVGAATRTGGLLSTIGFVAVPVVAALRGQPLPYIVASAAINVLIFLRRLEGIEDDVRAGISIPRAVYRRVVLDVSATSIAVP